MLGRIQQMGVGRPNKNEDRSRGEPSLRENTGKPNMVQSDKGKEFLNSTYQSMLQRHDIKFYTSENEDIKAAVVERFNTALKTKTYRYFTAKTPDATSTPYPICCILTTIHITDRSVWLP